MDKARAKRGEVVIALCVYILSTAGALEHACCEVVADGVAENLGGG